MDAAFRASGSGLSLLGLHRLLPLTCVYIYIHIPSYTHTYTSTSTNIYIYIYTYTYTYRYTYTYLYTYTYTYNHTYTDMYTYTYMACCTLSAAAGTTFQGNQAASTCCLLQIVLERPVGVPVKSLWLHSFGCVGRSTV